MSKALTNAIVAASLWLSAAAAHAQATPAEAATVGPPITVTKAVPATPIDVKKAELGGKPWDPAWDQIVEQAIPPDMLSSRVPRDVRKFCPNFYRMSETDKRVFWAYFFQALAGAEAGLEPTTNVRHSAMQKNDKATGQPVHSEGLLQLTFEDGKVYGCDFDWQADRKLPPHDPDRTILQPKNNLECGVMILENQIINLHKPLLTRHSYWSTLHPGTSSYHVFAEEMVNPPEACAKPHRPSHLKDATTATVHEQAQQVSAAQ